jgi:PilZ domain
MQSLSQIGNARREERVLLPALIELRSERGDEALTADGLDVSAGGVSVRAAFVPEVGTRLLLSFRCPPNDDAVQGLGEVMWSAWDGPRSGSFGMRFLELDTKSATAIRRYVAPDAVSSEEPELPRAATMRIDGLGAPIEADVRLYDQACIVLEQELSFLRLGRGIEVDLPGRGTERGRIASIELRQGPLDTPTLVFGILLDEQRNEVPLAVGGRAEPTAVRPDARVPVEARGSAREQSMDAPASIEIDPSLGQDVASAARSAPPPSADKRKVDEPRVVRVHTRESAAAERASVDEDDEVERALKSRVPEELAAIGKALVLTFAWLRQTLLPGLIAGVRKLAGLFSARQPAEQSGPSPFLVSLARMRAALGSAFTRAWKSLRKRRTTAPVPRVQRSAASVRSQQRVEPAPAPRSRRWLTVSLAALGIGLGVYALAPRSGADRLRVPRAEPSVMPLASTPSFAEPGFAQAEAAPLATSPLPTLASSAPSAAREPEAAAKPAPGSEPARADARGSAHEQNLEAPEPVSLSTRFGEPNVPNGRIFVLRMSGPVKSLEGEAREDGFSVRIPGRLALDRASPIATSHRAIARALILNRGEYAELTVEFLPGMRPKYQVAAKDSSIEVTLERL